MKAAIKSIECELGAGSLTHAELCARFGEERMEKIARLSGIRNRRVVSGGVCASDLAFAAAERLFERSAVGKGDVDLLIMATQSPDYLMPTTACILQDRLGLPKSCAAFDVNLGCSQYVYGLAVANAWIASGMAKNALLLAGDTPTRVIHPLDRSAVSLFGDGACATLVSASESGGMSAFDFGTDGAGFEDLIIPASGFRRPPAAADSEEFEDADGNIRTNSHMRVDGIKIFSFAYRVLPRSVNSLLEKSGLGVGDIDLFVFHQAGEKIIRRAAERIGIPDSKLCFCLSEIGNCGGSSVGVALADAAGRGRLRPGMRVVLSAFGVGLSWGSVLLEWSADFAGPGAG